MLNLKLNVTVFDYIKNNDEFKKKKNFFFF